MIRGLAAPLVGLSVAACAPKAADAPVAYRAPDCARPFAEQSTALTTQPSLKSAGDVGGEPYAYWSSADGQVSYVITKEASSAHPAILMQTTADGMKITGCAWGDRKAYDQLKAYFEGLKAWTRK